MRPVEFGEALGPGTQLTLFSSDKPDRLFKVLHFSLDETLGAALNFEGGIPRYGVKDEEGRIHLLINVPIEQKNTDQWWLWRPDQAGIDSKAVFDGALIDD
jgi:hypothetical protein